MQVFSALLGKNGAESFQVIRYQRIGVLVNFLT